MLAIAGGKGGCGKTTTTLGLARAHPDRVLAADLDWDMPNLHALAGVDLRQPPDAPDALETADAQDTTETRDTADVLDSVDATPAGRPWGPEWPGRRPAKRFECDVLPAPPVADAGRRDPLSGLTRLKSAEVPVLLDCPCGIGPDAVKPLSLADGTVIVTSVCRASLRGAIKTAEASRAVGTPVVGVIATRTATAGVRLEALFDAPVLSTVPEVDERPLAVAPVREAYERAIDRLDPRESKNS